MSGRWHRLALEFLNLEEWSSVMRRLRLAILAVAVAGGLVLSGAPSRAAQDLLFGGGAVTGVYFKAVLYACNIVNKVSDGEYNCIGRPGLGSVFNVNAVSRGLLDFGIVQSDVNFQAYNGDGDWEGKRVENLRSLFSLHSETVLLVTRFDTGIASVDDIRGRSVNLGNPGSGARVNAEQVLELYGIDVEDDIRAEGLQQNEANQALIEGKIDAFFYTVGNPAFAIEDIANAVDIRIVPIDSEAVRAFVAERPYLVFTEVPGGIYRGVDRAVPTFGVKATVVTRAEMSDEVVRDFVSMIFNNLDDLRDSYPVFEGLEPAEMMQGLSAPLHPAAEAWFQEQGLL